MDEKTKKGRQCFHQPVLFMVAEKLRFLKEKEANELLSSLGIKTFSSQVPRLGPFLC